MSVFWFFFSFAELSINKILCRLENVDQTDVKHLSRYIYYAHAFRWFVLARNALFFVYSVYMVFIIDLQSPVHAKCPIYFIAWIYLFFSVSFQVLSSIHQMDFMFVFNLDATSLELPAILQTNRMIYFIFFFLPQLKCVNEYTKCGSPTRSVNICFEFNDSKKEKFEWHLQWLL